MTNNHRTPPNPANSQYAGLPFPTHNVPDILAWQPPEMQPIIEKGILYRQTRLVLYGGYKAWKSMTAMDMAFAIATGSTWVGYTTKASVVLYIQWEIPHPLLRKRILKYATAHRQVPANLIFVTPHFLKLDKDYSMEVMKMYMGRFHPDVVVIDPLYRTLSGDISSSYDMAKFQDHIDLLADQFDFASIIVHHTRKDRYDSDGMAVQHGSQDLMGSSYLPNWLDTAVQLDRVTDVDVNLSFTAMRHAEEELPSAHLRFSHDTLGASLITGGVPAAFLAEDTSYLEDL